MKPVNFNEENLISCKCSACPVQENSSCAVELLDKMSGSEGPEIEGAASEKKHLPEPNQSPAVYCSSQVDGASCDDLEFNRACICPTCDVWQGHDLDYNYFCQNGAADKVEER